MPGKRQLGFLLLTCVCVLCAAKTDGQEQNTTLTVHWDKTIRVSQTTATLQVVVNPPLRRGTPVHDNAFRALQDLGADYVRYVPWLPYPRLGVAELEAPKNGRTSWDFSVIDPMTIDFLEATKGHSVILNFSTIPQWMYKTDKPVAYPDDPDQVFWEYEKGTELRDGSMKEVAPYWEVRHAARVRTPDHARNLYEDIRRRRGIELRRAENEIRGNGPGRTFGKSALFRIFSGPQKPQSRHSPAFYFRTISMRAHRTETPDIQQVTFFTQAEGFLNQVWYPASARAPFAGNSHYG